MLEVNSSVQNAKQTTLQHFFQIYQ